MGEKIILSILLAVMISTIASMPYASAVTVDGIIGVAEYANSALVEKTPDLGGIYDSGPNLISFAGGQIAGQHSDWELFWDFDATKIYFAADPMGSTAAGATGQTEIGVFLLAVTGDPNIEEPLGFPNDDCTGTFFSLLAHNSFFSLLCGFTGPPISLGSFASGSTPLSGGEIFSQGAVSTTLLPIEWNLVRADLARGGDTTYDGDLQCVWFRASAFDSRSVNNNGATESGVRTIFLKLDPSTPNCLNVQVGGSDVSINTSALLLAGVQSISMWMIPVVIAGAGIGVFVIKRRN